MYIYIYIYTYTHTYNMVSAPMVSVALKPPIGRAGDLGHDGAEGSDGLVLLLLLR